MRKLNLDLKYCYGIKELKKEFDFTNDNVICIYASNGLMKTSLAKTFFDLSQAQDTKDRIWLENKTKRNIKDENNEDIKPESVFVIEPYNEKYRSDRISTLLANEKLRKEYEKIHEQINTKISDLIENLKPLTKLKEGKEIQDKLSNAFTHQKNRFLQSLSRVKEEVETESSTPLGQVIYSDIFNEKVEKVLEQSSIKNHIQEYIQKYNELLDKSNFFKKGVFNHDNASTIAKNLESNGFFEAEHSVYLQIENEKKEITTTKDLKEAIEKEKKRILTDESLKKTFEDINKKLTKNKDLVKFRECLENNPIILTKLINLEGLRQDLWKEYLIKSKEQFFNLLNLYNEAKQKIEKITEKAKQEQTKWAQVLNIFNRRFSVPFVVTVGNQEDVILKKDRPSIQFDFLEEEQKKHSRKSVEENTLIEVLSHGEKRALYILNIIFEMEARKSTKHKTLFVLDDIADSFDYKNKYAIVEYLSDIKDNSDFHQIILTHNFDFYRTVSNRLEINKKNIFLADKKSNKIIFTTPPNLDPFSKWKNNLNNPVSLIASIPFIRQLAGYLGDDNSKKLLTSLLHIKSDTENLKNTDLDQIIKAVLKKSVNGLSAPTSTVKETIYKEATTISNKDSEYETLEEKIVLSIAIRLKAEEFIINKIDDNEFVKKIKRNQTIELIKKFSLFREPIIECVGNFRWFRKAPNYDIRQFPFYLSVRNLCLPVRNQKAMP